ncbi:hypothetical protein MMH89_04765 [Candidatus Comchoanobacter bicostacola]|uniref:Pyrroline-5-carboxylate reductase n=1 Tax=Candidatus Comchoanobacter bicostacola TaxID=2919598 RepID=A0ABY5DKK8_9GAMM|nr:hypothetical protein [Candidatus Comchoanobacter bicostacola]UTC24527.1 hypothetical protein MMH89_04765 [Candidatus Comchoanobacter bicostacola]
MIEVGVIGEDLAATHIASTLSESNDLRVHFTHTDSHTLEVLAGAHTIKPHRTREQLMAHCAYIIFTNPNDYHELYDKLPRHTTPIICVQPERVEDAEQIVSLKHPAIFFTPSFDIEAALGHSLLIRSHATPKKIYEDTEKIMRLCGTVQWVEDPSDYYILASISVILPMVSITVIEALRSYSAALGTRAHQHDLLLQNVLYSLSHALHRTNITPAVYASQACEYLGATQQYIKIADALKSCHFDKVLNKSLDQLIDTQHLPKKITQHIDDNNE